MNWNRDKRHFPRTWQTVDETIREWKQQQQERDELLHPPWKREMQAELEAQRLQREMEQLKHQVDELQHPPWRKQGPEQRGAPVKLTEDEAKRGRDLVCDEKKNDPSLTMDAAEAMLKQSLKHADGSPINVGRETWRKRVIRPAFKNARRK